MDPAPYIDPYNNTTGHYQENGENAFYDNQHQWNDQQQIPNYQSPNAMVSMDNFDYFPFSDENQQYFDENCQGSNNKRPLEYYGDANDMILPVNPAKRQKLAEPSIQYAMKKSSDYANPMRKALDLLFESQITADGWEKINNQIRYHITIHGITYYQWGNSIDVTRERAAEIALNSIVGLKIQQISWPQKLLSFRLEQPFADSIELLVLIKSKL